MAAPKQTDPQFKLRLTPEIKSRIEENAATNNRSLNAEMLDRLDKGLAHERLLGEIRRLESDVAMLMSQTSELAQSLERRERDLFTDLVKLRRLEPENESLRETIKSKDEIIELLQSHLSLMRMAGALQKHSINLLDSILDEAEAGGDEILKRTIANRKVELDNEQEDEFDELFAEMKRMGRIVRISTKD
ncbi:MAG: Arc family DNA-binding protein [Mesorhizobium sp.]|nr:MAG: Arc family DNA-binding protein [Mesorhizobium sp.]